MKTLIILGSARSDGNTAKVVDLLAGHMSASVLDISDKMILPYSYQLTSESDDFLDIAQGLREQAVIVFATPVYWYAMSGAMKTFFDRLTELITVRKDLGRALAGKSTALLATGTDSELPEGFEVPFRRTSEYLKMKYLGCLYIPIEKEGDSPESITESIGEFSSMLRQQSGEEELL